GGQPGKPGLPLPRIFDGPAHGFVEINPPHAGGPLEAGMGERLAAEEGPRLFRTGSPTRAVPCPNPKKPAVKTETQTKERRTDIDNSTPTASVPIPKLLVRTLGSRH